MFPRGWKPDVKHYRLRWLVLLSPARVPLQHQNFIPYKHELQPVNAVRWNPHHHCRMHLASAKGREVIVWRLEDAAATGVTVSEAYCCVLMCTDV